MTKTLPGHPDPSVVKGRIITLEFDTCYLVATYVPNAGEKLKVRLTYSMASWTNTIQALDAKKEWNVHFEKYIRDLDRVKPVIWTGDLNVAPTELGSYMVMTCALDLG